MSDDLKLEITPVVRAPLKQRLEEAAQQKDADLKQLDADLKQRDADLKQKESLAEGTFFSTLDLLWASQDQGFQYHLDSFVRKHHVAYDDKNIYRNTVDAAGKGVEGTTEGSSRTDSTSKKVMLDIFGVKDPGAESAYLLPHASPCASYWFLFVPLVLSTEGTELSWTFLQKCIHGSIEENNTNDTRQANVGIKHFPTNRIRLKSQKALFNKFPCVIIVPILTVEEVRSWNGAEYNAIVLAGDWKDADIEAAEVYCSINANRNVDANSLANENDCTMACELLKQMILYACKTFKDSTHLHENLKQCETMDKDGKYKKYEEWNNFLQQLSDKAPVPMSNFRNGMKIRKISFSKSNEMTNPAPDPLLLLAKAASSWLKRCQMKLLPVLGDDESSNSDSVISINEEFEIRGWSHLLAAEKRPRLDLVEVDWKRDTVDEPLSDDES